MPLRASSLFCGMLLALGTLALTSCSTRYYKTPTDNFAGRPIPPSLLQERVLVGVSTNGTTAAATATGFLEILDGLRDLRSNIQYTKQTFTISGYSSGYPKTILNFPDELRGYVYSSSDNSLTNINYGTEASAGSAASLGGAATAIAIPTAFTRFYAAEETAGQLVVVDNATGTAYALNLPNVDQVVVNTGDTVALAMVRSSDTLYRVFKLNVNQYPTALAAVQATGSIDCQPYNVPVYCAVPVPGNYSRPTNAYFSLDGSKVYVMNSGPEYGGTGAASISVIPQSALVNTIIPTASQVTGSTAISPVTATIPIPGGVTTAISDGTTLYLAGQSLNSIASNGTTVNGANANGLFAGYLTTMNLASQQVTAAYSISDGIHAQMLFADDNTLWIGSSSCATGVRQALFASGNTTQAANYNCLTMFNTSTLTPQIVPAVNQGSSPVTTPYPNTYQTDPYYYGDLGGICWVQNYHKVYSAYGGQIHAFNTADGSERDNTNITVQGTALTVAYMDALTDAAN